MPKRKLSEEEHFVRHCSRQKQVIDADGRLIGIKADAFSLRPERKPRPETYLSGAYFECIEGNERVRLLHILDILKTFLDVRPNTALAICNAGKIQKCGARRDRKLSVTHDPSRHNPVYSKLTGLPFDNSDSELLELLAAESVVALVCAGELETAEVKVNPDLNKG